MKSNSFFSLLFGVCTGLGAFSRIAKLPLWRALLHLLILSVLSSAIVAGVRSFSESKRIHATSRILETEFGSVLVDRKKGIKPEKKPGKARFVVIDSFRIDYRPSIDSSNELDLNSEGNVDKGVLWTPFSICCWWNEYNDAIFAMPMNFLVSGFRGLSKPQKLNNPSGRNLLSFADEHKIHIPTESPHLKISFSEISASALSFIVISTFLNIFSAGILFVPFFASFFALISSFARGNLPGSLKFTSLFKVSIYAAYPGIIIATLAASINFTLLDFKQICLLSTLVYLMAVMNSFEKLGGNKEEKKIDNNGF